MSCSTFNQNNTIRLPDEQQILFPDGKYIQAAEAHIITPQGNKDFDFNAVVKKSATEISFYGFSSFGLSLFKIHQVQNQPIELKSSINEISKNKEFFIQIFSLVKQIFDLKSSDVDSKNHKVHFTLEKIQADVEFLEYDQHHIPKKIQVETSNQSKIQIVTTDYTFTTGIDRH